MRVSPALDIRKRGGKVSLLTNRQRFVLQFIVTFMEKVHMSPVQGEIDRAYKKKYQLKGNNNPARPTVRALISKQCLVKVPGKRRGFRLTEKGARELSKEALDG